MQKSEARGGYANGKLIAWSVGVPAAVTCCGEERRSVGGVSGEEAAAGHGEWKAVWERRVLFHGGLGNDAIWSNESLGIVRYISRTDYGTQCFVPMTALGTPCFASRTA